MSTGFEQGMFEVQCVMAAGALVTATLWLLLRRLGRSRPQLSISLAVATGATLRVAAAVMITALAPAVRGPDEAEFLDRAHALLGAPLTGSQSIAALTSQLHVWLFAWELRIPDFPELAMRIFQVGISIAGLLFLVTAIHDLAGARVARIAAWLMMLEPSSIFFSGFLHKEPFMLLGAGLVAFGGARLWQRREPRALLPMVAGAGIATLARPYAGAMLFVAVAAIALHGSISKRGPLQRRSLATTALILVLMVGAAPAVLRPSSEERLLSRLQTTQNANTSDTSNLKLAPVDFSTRTKVIVNLPQRMVDVAFRPFPWQLGSANQRLGLPGTLVAIIVVLLLLRELLTPRDMFGRAGPLLYPAFFLFLAFSLVSGNAGTAFRLRSTVISLVIAAVVVLRVARRQQRAEVRGARAGAPAGAASTGLQAPPAPVANVRPAATPGL